MGLEGEAVATAMDLAGEGVATLEGEATTFFLRFRESLLADDSASSEPILITSTASSS